MRRQASRTVEASILVFNCHVRCMVPQISGPLEEVIVSCNIVQGRLRATLCCGQHLANTVRSSVSRLTISNI